MGYTYTLNLADADGNTRQTSVAVSSVSSLAQATSQINTIANVIEGMSDAVIVKGKLTINLDIGDPDAESNGNIWDRLAILLTDGNRYASLSIPAPKASLHWDTMGSYKDIRILPGENSTSELIDDLVDLLAQAVTPTGEPFPVGQWCAIRTENQT